jgi:biopolymer transport protein ExbD
MRRFSQRSHLVTLSEINITPLLDLAFVLLIIFVITTPLLEQGLPVTLPRGGRPDLAPRKEDVRTVDVSVKGQYVYQGQPMSLEQLEQVIVTELQAHPDLVVYIRADRATPFEPVFQLMDLCGNHGVQISARAQPLATP